jgi:hypothetical protein
MASRFNNGPERQAISRSARGSYSPWVQVPDLGCLDDSRRSGRKRIFAAVSRAIPTAIGGKTIRHILIFDNHTDSLRLIFGSGLDSDSDASWRQERRTSIICGSILIVMVVAAMLWPLLW